MLFIKMLLRKEKLYSIIRKKSYIMDIIINI